MQNCKKVTSDVLSTGTASLTALSVSVSLILSDEIWLRTANISAIVIPVYNFTTY